MRSKDKRLEDIRENRRKFRAFRKGVKANFPTKSPRLERDANLLEAQYSEESAKDLAKDLESANPNFDIPLIESYKLAALNYYQAGIYSVFISDPLNAFKCFKKSARNYRAFAELVKQEPIYGLIIQEANVSEDKARLARHEAAYRRARLKGLSLGCLGRK
jgi:hypothetical protein